MQIEADALRSALGCADADRESLMARLKEANEATVERFRVYGYGSYVANRKDD